MLRKLAYLGIAGICLLLLLQPSGKASAHVFLKSSEPASDQVLAQAPTQVVLVFSGDLKATGNQIIVTDAAEQHFEVGSVMISTANHAMMTIALKPLPDGIYTVTYTAVSDADGHETLDNYRFGVGNVTLKSNAPIRACALLPPVTPQADNAAQNASIRFVSPLDNSTLSTNHLDYSIQTDNFNLGSNGNYADVWVDGQKVQKIQSIGGHSLDLTGGIHDICISLVDGPSDKEIGVRAGLRLLVSGNTASTGPSSARVVIVIGVVVVIAIIVAVLIYRRRKEFSKKNTSEV